MAPSRGKSLCVPFDKEEYDAACVAAPESFRPPLPEVCGQHPELCPASLAAGFVRHDQRWSRTPQRRRRRLERKATAGVCLVRPSFLLPSMGGRTEAVAKALSLRPWGVPCDAWVSGFGRNALDWSHAARAAPRTRAGRREAHLGPGAGSLCADHGRRRRHARRDRDRGGLRRRAGGRLRRVCPGGRRAVAHLQPHDRGHRRLGRDAERLEAPLPDGGHPPVLPPLGCAERQARWA